MVDADIDRLIEAAAYHEAAHAVVALAEGFKVRSVTLFLPAVKLARSPRCTSAIIESRVRVELAGGHCPAPP